VVKYYSDSTTRRKTKRIVSWSVVEHSPKLDRVLSIQQNFKNHSHDF